MTAECEIVRDLIPLYADEVCSPASRALVERHLAGCEACQAELAALCERETEQELQAEKRGVLLRHAKAERRRSFTAGAVIAGIFMIPVLVCLVVNLATGRGLDWFFLVFAALLTAASVTVVPLMVPVLRARVTLASFAGSLVLLLGVCCLYTQGKWFFVAASASLFGLSVCFLPMALPGRQRGLIAMTADTLLFCAMMVSIGRYTDAYGFAQEAIAISAPLLLWAWALFLCIRYLPVSAWSKAGICVEICAVNLCFLDFVICWLMGSPIALPAFHPLTWDFQTINGNVEWLCFLGGTVLCAILFSIGMLRRHKRINHIKRKGDFQQ